MTTQELVAFKASVATGCLQTVMIEPKMLTQSVKALSGCLQTVMIEPKMLTQSVKALSGQRELVRGDKGDARSEAGMTINLLFFSYI